MKCPGCGREQPEGAAACVACGRPFEPQAGTSLQLPSAPTQATGQRVGKIILPEGIAPQPAQPVPTPRPSPVPTPKPFPINPAGPPTQSKHVGFDMEPVSSETPKSDVKKLVLPGVILLGLGGYFALRPRAPESPAPEVQAPAVAVATATAVAAPPPLDPAVESCKQGLVGQGFLGAEAEAYCLNTPAAWSRVKTIQAARRAAMSFTDPGHIVDVTLVPVKGEVTAEGRVRLYVYAVLNDNQNKSVGVNGGEFELTSEVPPVSRLPNRALVPEDFRRGVLTGHVMSTVHAFLGIMEFDAQATAGQMVAIGFKFDSGRLEHQAVVTF
ncbi:MAG: hypothetical protein HY924_01735 [Elusimicrobia bacterium]|nr:hypothetical protein [Elusimicrobiota bacterium]